MQIEDFMSSFLLVVISAVFHAGWNLALKFSKDKVVYSVHIQVIAPILFTPVVLIWYPESLTFHKSTLIFAFASAFFFALYQVLVAVAYKYADVSMVYPITTSSPLFIVVWAYFILHEHITLGGVIGIVLIIGGGYVMNLTRGTNATATKGVIFAIMSALFYSFGALLDKMGVNSVDTVLYIYAMLIFMAFFSYLLSFVVERKHKAKNEHKPTEWKLTIIGGVAIALSTVTYRLGLEGMQVSYATSLRQISAIFGVAIGIIFLKEYAGGKRIIGALIICAGIVLIRLGM